MGGKRNRRTGLGFTSKRVDPGSPQNSQRGGQQGIFSASTGEKRETSEGERRGNGKIVSRLKGGGLGEVCKRELLGKNPSGGRRGPGKKLSQDPWGMRGNYTICREEMHLTSRGGRIRLTSEGPKEGKRPLEQEMSAEKGGQGKRLVWYVLRGGRGKEQKLKYMAVHTDK